MEMRHLPYALVLSVLACAQDVKPRTELVVVVDSDLEVPQQLDEIVIATQGPGSQQREASAALGPKEPRLPRSLTLDYQQGELGPIAITVTGKLDGDTMVAREADVSFVAGRTLVVPMHLARRCRDVRCGRDETCTESGCADRALDEDALDEWNGEKPTLTPQPGEDASADAGEMGAGEMDAGGDAGRDAGVDAGRDAGSDAGRDAGADASADAGGDACVPRAETCNRRDDNCNGRIDEGFDLTRDVNNCGNCGTRCDTARGQTCVMSMCR